VTDDAIMQALQRIENTLGQHTTVLGQHTAILNKLEIRLGVQEGVLQALHGDVRMIHAAVNDMELTRFTAGEASAIHHDLNRLHENYAGLAVRVGVLEARAE
jgi:hypothetical protein